MDYKQIDIFEKVLEANGETLEQFNNRTQGMSIGTRGYEKVKLIAKAMNGGINVTEGYYPYFLNPNRAVTGFSYHVYFYDDGYACVSTCILMTDSERAVYAGETFAKEYSEYINSKLD
jgi:hypothetical protein